jgi:hypothetical protein
MRPRRAGVSHARHVAEVEKPRACSRRLMLGQDRSVMQRLVHPAKSVMRAPAATCQE